MDFTARDIAKMIDHSLLRPNLTRAEILSECGVALRYGVKTAAVVGFPHGYGTTTTQAIAVKSAPGTRS